MTKHLDDVDSSNTDHENLKQMIYSLKQFVEEEYGASATPPKDGHMNSGFLEIHIDIENQDQLETVFEDIQNLFETECPIEVKLLWKYIPTDSKGQKNGFHPVGSSIDGLDSSQVEKEEYPLTDLRIEIEDNISVFR